MRKNRIGEDGFIWWKGVVEDRSDPLFLGRIKVRIIGYHTSDKNLMPTDTLPWALPMIPLDHGRNTIGPRPGDWVMGFFLDDVQQQQPVVFGVIPGIPEDPANIEEGFNDPTTEESLQNREQPRPPDYYTEKELEQRIIDDEEEEQEIVSSDNFSDPNKLPFVGTTLGVLTKEYDAQNYLYDINSDGIYNAEDAAILAKTLKTDGFVDTSGNSFISQAFSMSAYPLEPELKEPTTSRLARGDDGYGNIENTIIAKKKSNIKIFSGASYEDTGLGDDPIEGEPFNEPETPYNAKYPFNHVYESESGHFFEIDDTPNSERIHLYHRSGSFRESHPDGTLVEKSTKDQYNLTEENYYQGSGKSSSLDAIEQYKIKAGTDLLLQSGGATTQQSGGSLSQKIGSSFFQGVGEDALIGIGASKIESISENFELSVGENFNVIVGGGLNIKVDGDISISCTGNFILEAVTITQRALVNISNNALGSIVNEAPVIGNNGIVNASSIINAVPTFNSITTPNLSLIIPPEFLLPDDSADNENLSSSALQPGFMWDGAKVGYLWKPISEGDGKPVSLGPPGVVHELYEAIPTGDLETVDIQYLNADASITTWSVVRPVHKLGNIIERPVFSGNANGGRDHYRYSKEAKDYPSQMFLKTGDIEWLIINAETRHD